jgi:purine-binding chemotaxis protein CheW
MTAPVHERQLRDAIADADRLLAAPAVAPAVSAAAPATSRYVLFAIASTHYAVPEAYVTELERVPRLTLVPRVPAWLRGVTNLRGDIVSVVDLRLFLGLSGVLPPSARLLVVRLLDEPFATGLIVDAVDRIITLDSREIAPPAAPLDGPLTPFLTGVCTAADRLVAVLDLASLLRSPDLRQFDEPRSVDASASADSH